MMPSLSVNLIKHESANRKPLFDDFETLLKVKKEKEGKHFSALL
jgi:hypothetical protein